VFTGLVRATGELVEIRSGTDSRTFVVAAPLLAADLAIGASVAVSGVCLTVTGVHARDHDMMFEAQAAFETLRRTTLGKLRVGNRVNLEPSLRVGDPLGGHLVSGHVDGVAVLRLTRPHGDAVEMAFEPPPGLHRFIASKGSVCLDGVSLTVNEIDATAFAVGLVPHTLAVTTLGARAVGDEVNLEIDVLARYVARLLDGTRGTSEEGLSLEGLRRAGFIPAEETP
jgi:riboflavin synthase